MSVADDDLDQYQPPRRRLRAAEAIPTGAEVSIDTEGGIIVTARVGDRHPASYTSGERDLAAHQPTRYAEALRRQASNRARQRAGLGPLPAVRAGDCPECDGWGVQGPRRARCPHCNGRGLV